MHASRLVPRRAESERDKRGRRSRRAAPKGTPRLYLVLPLNKCARVTCSESQCREFVPRAPRASTPPPVHPPCIAGCIAAPNQKGRERRLEKEEKERKRRRAGRHEVRPQLRRSEKEREKRDSCVRAGQLESKYRCYPTCNCRVGSTCERLRGLVCGRRLHSGKGPPRATAIPWHIISGVHAVQPAGPRKVSACVS